MQLLRSRPSSNKGSPVAIAGGSIKEEVPSLVTRKVDLCTCPWAGLELCQWICGFFPLTENRKRLHPNPLVEGDSSSPRIVLFSPSDEPHGAGPCMMNHRWRWHPKARVRCVGEWFSWCFVPARAGITMFIKSWLLPWNVTPFLGWRLFDLAMHGCSTAKNWWFGSCFSCSKGVKIQVPC